MQTKQKSPARKTVGRVQKPKAIAKKMSPQQQQFFKVIKMPSPELGAAIKSATERIARHVGNALAHDAEAKKSRDEAQREFQENIGYYNEAKQRLLNPGYRTDVDGGKERTPAENEKNFGAPNWAAFAERCVAYSLQHADRLLNAFAKANGVLDEGGNIDDPEPKDDEGTRRPQPRRTEDPTAQKRYEFIATAAMEIASRNPEGEVEKQILAAAEHVPAPLMPLPPDVFTEVLAFLTNISLTAADESVRVEAKHLASKMRLHKPAPQAAAVPPVVADEEKRKREKRLARKNGQPLGSAVCAPPSCGTSEHVQGSARAEEGRDGTPPEKSADYRPRKAKNQREHRRRKKDQQFAVRAAAPAAPQPAAPAPRPGRGGKTRKPIPLPKVTVCPPALSPEEEERIRERLSASFNYVGRRQGDSVLNEQGKWEHCPEDQQLLPAKLKASDPKPFRVEKRTAGDIIDFAVFRDGDNLPCEISDTKSEAEALCERLNAPRLVGIVPRHIEPKSAAKSAA